MNTIFIVLAIFGLNFSPFSYWANIIKTKSAGQLIRAAEGADSIWSIINTIVTLITTGQYTYEIVKSTTLGAISFIKSLIKT